MDSPLEPRPRVVSDQSDESSPFERSGLVLVDVGDLRASRDDVFGAFDPGARSAETELTELRFSASPSSAVSPGREYASAHGGLSDMDPGSPGSHTASPFPEDWSLKT
jgi:hypothetical protein